MADTDMIAATLAAAILVGRDFNSGDETPAEYAVATYHKVLAELAAATASLPPPARTPLSD